MEIVRKFSNTGLYVMCVTYSDKNIVNLFNVELNLVSKLSKTESWVRYFGFSSNVKNIKKKAALFVTSSKRLYYYMYIYISEQKLIKLKCIFI